MKEDMWVPDQIIINLYQDGYEDPVLGDEHSEKNVPWYITTSYLLIDEDSGMEAYTEPVVHSMN